MLATLPPEVSSPRRIGRWFLTSLIGRGAFGAVWRAVEAETGRLAAVKLLAPTTTTDLARIRREVAALRLLKVPGVVELYDSGMEDGRPFIAMEFVEGTPFPGGARDWHELVPLCASLCETLRQVHARGVVHRDLKPGNVFVRGDRVVVLDFGVARGTALGETFTATSEVVGTPRYLAPEQLDREAPVDGRADIYALGVMLYEALADTAAFPGRTAQDVMVARLVRDAPRLEGVPANVADLVARMLARRPEDRLTADQVFTLLAGDLDRPLPWLGSRSAIDVLLAAASEGRSLDVWGPPGVGTSRVLDEVGATLGSHRVWRLVPGRRPLESLGGEVQGSMVEGERRLLDALTAGEVVMADDLHRLDRWTRALLERARNVGAVLRAAPGGLELSALQEADLRTLFHGPDRLHHLQEDGARVLYARTGGVPGRVAEELRAWTCQGEATWIEGRIRVDRRSLDRLAAAPVRVLGGRGASLEGPLDTLLGWVMLAGGAADLGVLVSATGLPEWEVEAELEALIEVCAVRRGDGGRLQALLTPRSLSDWSEAERSEVHRRLAAALPEGGERLVQLLASGDEEGLERATLTYARSLIRGGEVSRARSALDVVAEEAQSAGRPVPDDVIRELVRSALVDGTGEALRAVARVIRDQPGPYVGLLGAWEAIAERRYDEALAPIPTLDDPDLDAWRRALTVRVSMLRTPAQAEVEMEALSVPAGSVLARRRLEWFGHLRYWQGRYSEAARLHEEAAADESNAARRATALINSALALRDDDRLPEAAARFQTARAIASKARLVSIEAHAEVGVRTTAYRSGRGGLPDLELLAALELLGDDRLIAPACLNEAAVAWRDGDAELAERLARRAAQAWSHPDTRDGWILATALACAAGRHRGEALRLPEPGPRTGASFRAQVATLKRMAGDGRTPSSIGGRMLDVLSLTELDEEEG